ncbi:MAG: hypothetical protein J7L77_04340 [Clostridiales bacterium]|nr:hypothetical protein [Clostridiales bacterium]
MKKLRFIPLYCLLFLVFASLTLAEDRLIVKDGSNLTTFKVEDTGNVFVDASIGIGTETPARELHISNGLARLDRAGNSSGFMVTRTDGAGNVLKSYFFGVNASAIDNGEFFIRDYGTATGGDVFSNRLFIANNGNIGIGTDDPQGKLDVYGSIYQRGGELYADYVFDEDYTLETIEDHAKQMWGNKHLPSVPKATTDKHGNEIIELGTHRRGLLEELEKAHIYIEQLNQRLKQLEKKLVSRK